VYSIPTDSHRYQLQALQQVSVFPFSRGLQIVPRGNDPQVVTQSLDLRRGNIYFLLLDMSLDHDDLGGVFYGRSSQVFSPEDSSTAFPLFQGRNRVGIPLPCPGTLERIPFDPGHRRGSYILAGFSIEELSGDTVLGIAAGTWMAPVVLRG